MCNLVQPWGASTLYLPSRTATVVVGGYWGFAGCGVLSGGTAHDTLWALESILTSLMLSLSTTCFILRSGEQMPKNLPRLSRVGAITI